MQNALHEMLQCMDRGKPEDCERFAQLFTEDAVVEVPLAKVYKLEIQKSALNDLCHKFSNSKVLETT